MDDILLFLCSIFVLKQNNKFLFTKFNFLVKISIDIYQRENMDMNTNNNIIYQLQASSKYENLSVDKIKKSSFEKNDVIDTSANTSSKKEDSVKRIEKQISSMPSLNNAKEELTKSSNLNRLFLQSMI